MKEARTTGRGVIVGGVDLDLSLATLSFFGAAAEFEVKAPGRVLARLCTRVHFRVPWVQRMPFHAAQVDMACVGHARHDQSGSDSN